MPNRTPSLSTATLLVVLSLLFTGLVFGHSGNHSGSHAATVPGSVSTAGIKNAHPFVQTIANVFVGKTRLTINISSSADELDLIHGIIPDEAGKYDTKELVEGVDIHADFLLERFEVYDSKGNKLKGKLIEKRPWEIPPEGFRSGELVDYMLDYTFEYEYGGPPEYLTFQNNIIDYDFLLPSEVKMLVKQAGSDVPYSALLKLKEPETVRFDWDKPLKRVITGEELNAWFNETREKTLGITSYGGTYSFIYLTPREVRLEVLVPLANLLEFMTFEQEDKYYLTVEEQDKAVPKIEEFFSTGIPVVLNDEEVPPRFDLIEFAGLNVRDFGKKKDRQKVSLANGRVGVIMSFPRRNLPDRMSVTWTDKKFSNLLKDVDVVFVGPDEKVTKHQFSSYVQDNTIKWVNPGIPPLPDVVDVKVEENKTKSKPPVWFWIASAGAAFVFLLVVFDGKKILGTVGVMATLAGSAFLANTWPNDPTSPEKAEPIFESLHTNLFRAFDYNTEEDVYDALAQTIDGPLLQKMYLDMRRSLEVKEQGGAVANIERIEIMKGQVSDETASDVSLKNPAFAYRCSWELEGTVEHWGHIHRRTNKYEALFNVKNVDGHWKITEFQPIDEQQGPVIRKLRKF